MTLIDVEGSIIFVSVQHATYLEAGHRPEALEALRAVDP